MDQPLTADCLKTATMLLTEIGIRLDVITVEDPLHFSELLQRGDIALWYGVRAMDAAEVFFAAYHSNEISKSPLTGGLNTFRLSDKSLDDLLETAAHAADDTEKDQLYQSARDKILDWAVEVPLYLERSLTVLSAQRVDQKSLPADPTGFWNWLHEMENLKTAE
jgi:ABC-type transport system substrate-binding protein